MAAPDSSGDIVTMSSSENPKRKTSLRFSIRSIFVITAVFAAGALGAGHLVRAANGDLSEIGPFVVATAMAPMLLMVAMSWGFRIARWINNLDMDEVKEKFGQSRSDVSSRVEK